MSNLNRIKVVLVEQQKVNGWQNKWVNQLAQSANGVVTPVSQIWRHWIRLLHY